MTQDGPRQADELQPTLVLWEAYREADPQRRWRDDLSTLEAMRLLNEVRCFGRIAIQLVGRPLRRSDLALLIEHGARIGLSMRVAPGPDALYEETVAALRDAGLQRLVLDADRRPEHVLEDEIRMARRYGLGVHVINEASVELVAGLEARSAALAAAGAHVWVLDFPLEPVAALRGAALDGVLREVAGKADGLPLRIEIGGAPQLRRVLHECGCEAERLALSPREGYDVLYIAGNGQVQPSPDLPLVLGNAREHDVVDMFRDAPVMCALRDPSQLRGKCRLCEFVVQCGGSRARAWARIGDWLAPDPACAHRPPEAAAEEGLLAAGAPQGT